MRIYAIADIHGQLDMLTAAHARITADKARCGDEAALIVHLGDLVDRGPDSKGVIDFLLEGVTDGQPWVVLKGNHDRMFRGFMERDGYHDRRLRRDFTWFDPRLGGEETLASYGVVRSSHARPEALWREAQEMVPVAHVAFLDRLEPFHATDDLLFVHAGIRPGLPLEAQVEDDLIWIREGFLEDDRDHGRLVVHGHTALPAPQHFGNRIDLDGGAGYGRPLTAAVFEGRDCWVLTDSGRVALPPPPGWRPAA